MQSWVILALLSAAFAAAVAILGKLGLASVDPTTASTARALMMAVCLVVASLALGRQRGLAGVAGRPMVFIFLSGLAGALSWVCYFAALRTGSATAVAALDRLSVVFVLLLSAIFLGEPIGLRGILGVVLMVAGAVLIVSRGAGH